MREGESERERGGRERGREGGESEREGERGDGEREACLNLRGPDIAVRRLMLDSSIVGSVAKKHYKPQCSVRVRQ